MAVLDVTIKAKVRLDDDLVDSFKVQDVEDQIRGVLDEGTDFAVTVQKNQRLSKEEEDLRAAAEAAKKAAAEAKQEAEAAEAQEDAPQPADE